MILKGLLGSVKRNDCGLVRAFATLCSPMLAVDGRDGDVVALVDDTW